MRLKSLELHGFKSFPDKTLINFDEGMTVIVGPNGSGKSNISDAMRWVLGETSQKTIRSTKTEDVIFDGSSSRSPMTYAEVSLIIDNTGEGSKLPLDYDEVEITRRYYRSGESEYMINRKAVRLRDIHELFMNTGVGKTGYSIVSQGKVADILSQKSDERRNVFEEAAGISKYRHKKNESERHLESTRENLVRLNDIVSELESRVGPLEKESEKAKKYLEIYDKKKQVDVSLWLYDVRDLAEKLEKSEKDLALAQNELSIIDETVDTLEKQSERLYDESQANRLEYEKNENEIRAASEKKYSFESAIQVANTEITHLSEQIALAESESSLLCENVKTNEQTLNEQKAKAEELEKILSSNETLRAEADERLENAGITLAGKENSLDSLNSLIKAKEDEQVAIKLELSSLSGTKKSEDSRVRELYIQRDEVSSDYEMLKERLGKAEGTVKAYQAKADEAKAASENAEKELRALEEELRRAADEKSAISLGIASKRQRADVLMRMEEHFEGYANSVRFVMQEASEGRLDGVCGPVSKLISVTPEYTTAIETALGANLQNVAVEDERAAKAAIRLLKEKNAGRSTFYPLNAIRPNRADISRYKSAKGFIGLASDLVTTESRYTVLAEYLLGRTLIFEDLDTASFCAKANGYPIKMVTLDGQVINAGGSYTGGSAKRDSGILSRASEIERLNKECAELSLLEKKAESERAAKEKRMDELKSLRDSSNGNASLLLSLLSAENTQYEVLKTQADADEKTLAALLEDIERYEKSGEYFTAEEKRKQEKESALAAELEGLYAKRTESENEIRALTSELEELRRDNSQKIVALTESRKDFETLNKEKEFTEQTLLSSRSRLEELGNSLVLLKEKKDAREAKLRNDSASLTEADELVKKLDSLKEEFAKKTDEYEKRSNELRLKIKEKTADRETVFRSVTQLESRVETLKNDRDKAGTRIWDEYELSYSSAKELGYPEITKENRKENATLLAEYKQKLKSLGNVNVGAIDEYKEVKERYDFMSGQIADLETSEKSLLGIISKLEKEMRERFTQAMSDINAHFKTIFRDLFDGGDAELILTDPENVLESGIEIAVSPPGKIIKNLVSLSGGEQAFVAIALFFAILRVNPTPFCIFDEIESALDEVNVVRFAEYAKKRFSDSTQFVMITHRRGTMEAADTLYGVTMYEKGISKVLTVNVRDIEDRLGIKLN